MSVCLSQDAPLSARACVSNRRAKLEYAPSNRLMVQTLCRQQSIACNFPEEGEISTTDTRILSSWDSISKGLFGLYTSPCISILQQGEVYVIQWRGGIFELPCGALCGGDDVNPETPPPSPVQALPTPAPVPLPPTSGKRHACLGSASFRSWAGPTRFGRTESPCRRLHYVIDSWPAHFLRHRVRRHDEIIDSGAACGLEGPCAQSPG